MITPSPIRTAVTAHGFAATHSIRHVRCHAIFCSVWRSWCIFEAACVSCPRPRSMLTMCQQSCWLSFGSCAVILATLEGFVDVSNSTTCPNSQEVFHFPSRFWLGHLHLVRGRINFTSRAVSPERLRPLTPRVCPQSPPLIVLIYGAHQK